MSTVAGLPQFMVLKSKSDGKYLHYLWNDPSFGPYVNDLGCKRDDIGPFNPFVKLEVVRSTSDPTRLIHLRCSHNNKFLQLDSKYGVSWVSATATGPDESTARPTSTLFRPIFPAREPNNTVGFLHVQKNCHVRIFFNQGYSDDINGVACAYTNDGENGMHRFEFAAWESYDDKIRKLTWESDGKVTAKDGEIRQLRASNVANMNAKEGEIQKLKSSVTAKDGEIQNLRASNVANMNAKEGEIQKLKSSVTAKDGEIQNLRASNVANMNAKEGEIQKLKSSVTAKDGEIQNLRASNVANMNAKEGEIQKLKSSYEEKMKAKDDEIQELKEKAKDGDGGGGQADDIVAELRMEIAELKVLLEDANKENDELKAAAGK